MTRWLPTVLLLLGGCIGFRSGGDRFYRCPQLGEAALTRQIEAHGVRTVVGLRGRGDGMASSARAALAAGATFRNVPMSATRLPAPTTLLALWDVAAHAERPFVLHCRAGVDRTGLAAAVVTLHDTGDLARARAQLDFLWNGHTGLLGTDAMDEVLDRYAPHHGTLSFPDWVAQVYATEYAADHSDS